MKELKIHNVCEGCKENYTEENSKKYCELCIEEAEEQAAEEEAEERLDALPENLKKLSKSLKCGMFAKRDSIREAEGYATMMINTLPKGEQLGMTTMLQVMMNTIASEIDKINQ